MSESKSSEQVRAELGMPRLERIHAALQTRPFNAVDCALDLIEKIWPRAFVEFNDDEGYCHPLTDRSEFAKTESAEISVYKDKGVYDFFNSDQFNSEPLKTLHVSGIGPHFTLLWDEDPSGEIDRIAESVTFYLSLLGMIKLDKEGSAVGIPPMLLPILELVEAKKRTPALAS